MPVLADEKLAVHEILDMQKFKNLLSIATKAGKVKLGFDAAKAAMAGSLAESLLLSNELSLGTKSSIIGKAEQAGVNSKVVLFSLEQAFTLVGRRVGIIAVTDPGFAKGLDKLIAG